MYIAVLIYIYIYIYISPRRAGRIGRVQASRTEDWELDSPSSQANKIQD